MLRHRMTPDNGQAFVELALVLPVFTLMLVGIAEVGRLAYASIEVNNAARAGVAYAAQTNTTAADATNITLAAKQDAAILSLLTSPQHRRTPAPAKVIPAPSHRSPVAPRRTQT